MLRARFWRQIDYLLLLAIAGLVGYGLMMIHSATCSPSWPRSATLREAWNFRRVSSIAPAMCVTSRYSRRNRHRDAKDRDAEQDRCR